MARIYLGNVKGPKGDTGATGATGPQGEAATIEVGSVSTTAYGNAAQVTNVGSSSAARFNFVIPQGKPGEKTTKMGELTLDTITTSEDSFPSPSVGDSGAAAFGKIVKWFADGLAALTGKLDANKIVNSQAVTEAGYGLDALQANPSVSGSLAAQISDLNDSLTNIAAKSQANDQIGSGGAAARVTDSQIYRYGALRIVQARISILSTISDASNFPLMNILEQDIPYQPVSQRVPGVITILPPNGTERSYTCLGHLKPASNGTFYLYQSATISLAAGTTLDIILIYPTA